MMILFIILAASILLGWSGFYHRCWHRNLDAQLYFENKVAYAGEQASLSEVISNRKKLPLPEIEVAFRLPKGVRFTDTENIIVSDFVYKRDIFSLRGMESISRKYRLSCDHRGRYPISQTVIRARSPMHRSEYEYIVDISNELLVYAARCNVSDLLAVCDSITGSMESPARYIEDPFTFSSVREYTTTDPLRNINWKATAKTGRLMTNTFNSVRSEQFFIFLDISDPQILKEEDLVEKGISIGASLCRELIRKGLDVGFAVNLNPAFCLPPRRGAQHLRQIEQVLTADFAREKTVDFGSFLEETACGSILSPQHRENRIAIVISKGPENRLSPSLHRLRTVWKKPTLWVQPIYREGAAVYKAKMI